MAANDFEVMREYPPLGKFRVRIIVDKRKPPGEGRSLDIREYVAKANYEGFSKHGIRIREKAMIDLLKDILGEVLAQWDQ